MTSDFYIFVLTERRRMLADAGFARDDLRIWTHPDGRAIGEGVAAALTDEAFLRYLNVEIEPVYAGKAESNGFK
jgi:predicted transglutaminase-like cysteine proteinase